MTQKLGYRDGGKTSEEGINRIASRLISSGGVFHDTDMAVSATGTPDNHVNVSTGDIAIGNNSPNTADPDYYYNGWNTASQSVTVSANSSGNPRVDVVVAYVDLSVVSSVSNDNVGALAFAIVAGTPAATPAPPSDATIQSSIGASNPWLPLAQVAAANGFSSISNSNITNLRPVASTTARISDTIARDYVGNGLLWSQSTGLIGQMTTGFAVIGGEVVNKSYLLHTFTASKDTYVDVPVGSKPTSTDDLTYTAVSNGAASPALAAGSIRIAKVVTNGSAITSVVTSGDDSLGNPISLVKPAAVHTHADNTNGGLLGNNAFSTNVQPVQRFVDNFFDHIVSGCVWSGDAYASTRLASMTSGVVYINGVRLTVATVTSHTFTASKDTYVDLTDNGDGTAAFTYVEVSNNAASPALTSNGVRIAIIITGASNIAAATSVNQGQETMLLPIASSVPYCVTDSLGNLICPRDPNRKLLGYKQSLNDETTASSSYADIARLSIVPVIVPAGRKIILSLINSVAFNSAGGAGAINIYDVTSSIQITEGFGQGSGTGLFPILMEQTYTPPASGLRIFKVQFKAVGGGTFHTNTATYPLWLKVGLQ